MDVTTCTSSGERSVSPLRDEEEEEEDGVLYSGVGLCVCVRACQFYFRFEEE